MPLASRHVHRRLLRSVDDEKEARRRTAHDADDCTRKPRVKQPEMTSFASDDRRTGLRTCDEVDGQCSVDNPNVELAISFHRINHAERGHDSSRDE